MLRELNASIRNLADAEQLRQNTETTLRRKKYARRGLGALSTWAAGGGETSKSYEEELDEAKSNAISMHRESVLWYLRQKLQECGSFQASMMETRIVREMEKNKSMLYKAREQTTPALGGFEAPKPTAKFSQSTVEQMDERHDNDLGDELSGEQLQVLEKENFDMMKHYEDTLNQVRYDELRCANPLIRLSL